MTTPSPYSAAETRYDTMPYRRCGVSGLDLPALSLGLWHNFGGTAPFDTQRAILRRAFDLGITHLDLANNYGPPYGSAEENFGRHLKSDLRRYRDELVISTKAGYDMWPGPYGNGGSRKYLLSSLDASLHRMGLEYVDIFYSHRPDPGTPIEETMGALDRAVRSGKALYAGISSYSPAQTRAAVAELTALGTPLLVHQPSYSMVNRHIERAQPVPGAGDGESLLETAADLGFGIVVFSPLQEGLLTDRYLAGEIPAGSRAAVGGHLRPERITPEYLERARALNEIAAGRGQSLAQLALSWVLRDARVTSAIIGASSVRQLEDNVGALAAAPLTSDELAAVEPLAHEL